MLSRPEYGWTDFSLEEGKGIYGLSYLTNVPMEWLNQAIHGLETLEPFAVHGVLEPGRVICLVSYWNCHIIVEDEDRKMLKADDTIHRIVHVSMLEFCKMLYEDILVNIEDWSDWDCDNTVDTEVVKKELKEKLDILKKLIAEKECFFAENRQFF